MTELSDRNAALELDPAPRPRLRAIGPGLVVAATGLGAGDLVATLIAGSMFGYSLLWAVVLGCVVRIALAEGTARWHLATGTTCAPSRSARCPGSGPPAHHLGRRGRYAVGGRGGSSTSPSSRRTTLITPFGSR